MRGLRIWHVMMAAVAAAVFFAVARFDDDYNRCSPLAPFLGLLYICALLGLGGARRTGRRSRTGLLLGLLLGPIGVIVAWSNPIEEDTPELDRG
jgi:hypothetical protein